MKRHRQHLWRTPMQRVNSGKRSQAAKLKLSSAAQHTRADGRVTDGFLGRRSWSCSFLREGEPAAPPPKSPDLRAAWRINSHLSVKNMLTSGAVGAEEARRGHPANGGDVAGLESVGLWCSASLFLQWPVLNCVQCFPFYLTFLMSEL